MKTISVLLLSGLLALPLSLRAQEDSVAVPPTPPPEDAGLGEEIPPPAWDHQPGEPPPPPPDQMPPRFHRPPTGPRPFPNAPFGSERMGGPGRRPIELWMEYLQQNNPQEFERLRALREEDPEAFRQEIDNRLRQEQFRTRLHEIPKVYDFFMNLPPEERQAAMEKLRQATFEPGAPPSVQPGNPELQRLEQETRKLSKAYRIAPAGEKEQMRKIIRDNLEKLFDLREQQQRQYMEQVENKLNILKAGLEKRQGLRDQIIERRLQELTEGDPLAW